VSVLTKYWARLNNKPARIAGAFMFLVAMVLFLNNPVGSAWNHVGWVFYLVGMIGLGLVFWLPSKRHQ
jgi:hypothetical protein